MSTAPGPEETISHYRLLELIGRGAMGEVWLAEDTQLPRKVAVKLLPRHLAQDRDSAARLLREAQAAASVDHPAVVTVYESGLAEGRPYIVMQRVEGETLARRLESGALPMDEALHMAREIADALAEVHALGIVHRDLKPANIVLTARGPKILDFGLASVRNSVALTAEGGVIGTPLWMSPEQLRGLPADNRSDLWALGVMLYQMITGVPPFRGETLEAVAQQILHHQPPPPSTLRGEAGHDLDFIVMKLLRKDVAHRYARAEEVLADFASCQASLAEEGAMPVASSPRLAVLYFEVMSPNPDDGYLAAGLTEDLIVDLTRVEGLQVASRAEVLAYRDRALPPRTLGRELNVDYLMLGSVRRAGQRARISAQLVRASDGHALWGDRFDRTLEDLFEVQAEVSKRIVEALRVALKPGEREMLERAPTKSAEAYALYLRGRAETDQDDRASSYAAEELLASAIQIDPEFALAHATLGECYAWRGLRWWASIEVADQALLCARRALEIEPDLFEAHLVTAMVHRLKGEPGILVQLGEREAGLREIARALQMAPEDGRIRYNAACTYAQAGLPEEAIAQLKEGTRNIPSYLMDWPRHDPDLASVREHPEFIRLFGRSGDA